MNEFKQILFLSCLASAVVSCADAEPPNIVFVSILPDTNEPAGPYTVDAVVSDDRGLDKVQLWWCVEDLGDDLCRTDFNDGYHEALMERVGEDEFRASMPGRGYDVMFEYYVLAVDQAGNQAAEPADAPVGGVYSFSVTP